MKLKTTELQDEALDWAVAKCKGLQVWKSRGGWIVFESYDCPEFRNDSDDSNLQRFCPTYDWAQGGPIIEQENISVFMDDEKWAAYASHSLPQNFYGTSKDPDWDDGDEGSPLVAAMRCYVASVLGDEVEVPDEIL